MQVGFPRERVLDFYEDLCQPSGCSLGPGAPFSNHGRLQPASYSIVQDTPTPTPRPPPTGSPDLSPATCLLL